MVDLSGIGQVQKTLEKIDFSCEIFFHEKSGRTTSDAQVALGIEQRFIIKCLLLKSKKGNFIAAVIRGLDKLDIQKLEKASTEIELIMADSHEIKDILGFQIGGISPVAVYEKGINSYVDQKVLNESFVVASAGTPNFGMKFNPKLLIEKLNYHLENISIDSTKVVQ